MPNDDYIKRSEALKAIRYENWREGNRVPSIEGLHLTEYQLLAEAINNIPAADVEPKRKTGRWSVIGGKIRRDIDKRIVKCTLCCNYLSLEGVNCGRGDANYCPNCGAKMEGETE